MKITQTSINPRVLVRGMIALAEGRKPNRKQTRTMEAMTKAFKRQLQRRRRETINSIRRKEKR